MTPKERWQRWYAANREHYNATQRAYWKRRRGFQLLSREELRRRKLARMASWREANPDLVAAGQAAINANRRAARRGLAERLASGDVLALWTRQPLCISCGSGRGVDHVVPMREGGTNTPDNLQTLCPRCNSRKENAHRASSAAARSAPPK